MARKSIEEKAIIWDARYNFPRPINEQYLNSYKAFMRYTGDLTRIFGYFVLTLGSFLTLFYIWLKISEIVPSYSPGLYAPILFFCVIAVLAFLMDYKSVMWAYSSMFQRISMGTAKWATEKHLKDKELISRNTDDILPKKVPLVPIGMNSQITIPSNFFAQHGIVLGPSGCGKTSTTFMNLARSFSQVGSLIALDISKDKAGEFYAYTVDYFEDAYRFDLMNSAYSDWFFMFDGCKGNSTQAGKVAAYIIGRDGNKADGGGDIWDVAAEAMLKCLILHICELPGLKYPTPNDIYDFLAANPTDAIGDDGKPFNKLKFALENSPNKDVQTEWKVLFSAVGDSSPKTYGSIVFTLLTKTSIFRDPKVQEAMRPPTPEEIKAGRRKIDFTALRKMTSNRFKDGKKRGRAIYVIISEGEAGRLKTVLASFFGIAKDALKQSGDKKEDAYVLFALDEAGNVPLVGLSEDFGVGRGRKMIFFLGFQGISQLSKQYGNETARTIFENTGTYLIFPGAKDGTAEWVEKMLGKTTTLLRSASDSVNDNYDSERLSESQRPLMFADEIRRMKKFTRCIVLFDDVDPILARVNDDAKTVDPRRFMPKMICFKTPEPQVVDFTYTIPVNSDSFKPHQVETVKEIMSETENEESFEWEDEADNDSFLISEDEESETTERNQEQEEINAAFDEVPGDIDSKINESETPDLFSEIAENEGELEMGDLE